MDSGDPIRPQAPVDIAGTLTHVAESQGGTGSGASGPGVKAGASVRELGRTHLEGGREKVALPSTFLESAGPMAVLRHHPQACLTCFYLKFSY